MTSNFNALDTIVQDIIKNMTEVDKLNVIDTSEEELIMFHHGWGTGIRNFYGLWHNKELLNNLEAKDADEASRIIIKAVWKVLNE